MAVPCAILGRQKKKKTMSRRLDLLMMNKARHERRKADNRHGDRFVKGRVCRNHGFPNSFD